MSEVLLLLLGLATFLAGGDLLVALLRPTLGRSAPGRAGLAMLLGLGGVTWATFALNLTGLPLGGATSWTVATVVLVGWSAVELVRRRTPATRGDDAAPDAGGAGRRLTRGALVLLIAVPVLIGAAFTVATPPVKDSLANWSLKTLVLFEDRTVFTEDFLKTDRYLFHPNYPLLVPLAQVYLYGLAGAAMDQAAKLVSPLAHLGVVLLLLGYLRTRMSGRAALLFAALLASVPHFYRTDVLYRFAGSGPSGYGDPMFTAMAGACVLMIARWLSTRAAADLVTGALFLGFALFTKNEALPLCAAVGGGAVLGLVVERVRGGVPMTLGLRGALAAGPALLLVTVPWFLYRAGIPSHDENYARRLANPQEILDGLWRVPTILVQTVEEALSASHHGLVWPLLVAALIAGRRRLLAGVPLFLLAVITAMALVYFAVFVVTPLPVVDSLVTSIPRTFFHLTVVAVALVACLAGPAPPPRERP